MCEKGVYRTILQDLGVWKGCVSDDNPGPRCVSDHNPGPRYVERLFVMVAPPLNDEQKE